MGWQVIKQPNGKYAIWGSVTDSFHYFNLTPKQVTGIFLRSERENHEKRCKELKVKIPGIIEALDKGEKPRNYAQFTMSWQEALNLMSENHGEKRVAKVVEKVNQGRQTEDEDDGSQSNSESEDSAPGTA